MADRFNALDQWPLWGYQPTLPTQPFMTHSRFDSSY